LPVAIAHAALPRQLKNKFGNIKIFALLCSIECSFVRKVIPS